VSLADKPSALERKLARNQMLFREVNEQIRRLSLSRRVAELDLVCECSSDQCRERLVVPVEEYELIRGRSDRFLVAPGHEDLNSEQPIGEYHGYVVVSKPATHLQSVDGNRTP